MGAGPLPFAPSTRSRTQASGALILPSLQRVYAPPSALGQFFFSAPGALPGRIFVLRTESCQITRFSMEQFTGYGA